VREGDGMTEAYTGSSVPLSAVYIASIRYLLPLLRTTAPVAPMRHNGHETSKSAWAGGSRLGHGISTGRGMAGRVGARQKDRDERRRVNYCGAVPPPDANGRDACLLEVAVTRTGQAGSASVARHIQT